MSAGPTLSQETWAELEQVIDRFEDAWLSGAQPRIEDYLAAGHPQRQALLVELVHTDLERRLQRGELVEVETYLKRYPELAQDRSAVLELIAAEYELRQDSGTSCTRADYLRRFPEYSADLSALPERPRHAQGPAGEASTPAPAVALAAEVFGAASCPAVPGYEIVEELGRGGMGVVYKARQLGLDRWVALKMILAGPHAGPDERARFRAEAEAVARLQHANIVQVYEVGEQEGRPYLTLEYVTGGSLAQGLTGTPLPAQQAAALIETLARAMHYAHGQGIVHRDLKPANVLLAVGSGQWAVGSEDNGLDSLPTAHCPLPTVPKITDFGLAKRTDKASDLTRSAAIIGTPSYMAPEQVGGTRQQVGPAADIYALGAMLYELLTGRPPFRAATPLETLEQVRVQEPVAPRRLQPKVPRDLEIVCLKCLEKEPRARYRTADALADDLRRFLSGRPIQARATPTWERLAKWARRRPAVAALLLLVLVVTVLGFGAVVWQWQQTRAGLAKAEANLYSNRIALADREWLANHVDRTEQLLAECPPELRGWEWHYLRRLCHRELRTLASGAGLGVAYRPRSDNRYLAVASTREEAVQLWDLTSGQRVFTLAQTGPAVAFSPDGRHLASATWKVGPSGELLAEQPCVVKLWDAVTGQELQSLPGHGGTVFSLAFSPDGRRLASASLDRSVRVWDLAAGKAVLTFAQHAGWVESVAFSPDGRLIASAGTDDTVRVWEAANGRELLTLGGDGRGSGVATQPRMGALSRVSSVDRGQGEREPPLVIWDATTGQLSPFRKCLPLFRFN